MALCRVRFYFKNRFFFKPPIFILKRFVDSFEKKKIPQLMESFPRCKLGQTTADPTSVRDGVLWRKQRRRSVDFHLRVRSKAIYYTYGPPSQYSASSGSFVPVDLTIPL